MNSIILYSIVAWDADFCFDGEQWTYNNFVGNRWMNVNADERKLYLKNAYRILLPALDKEWRFLSRRAAIRMKQENTSTITKHTNTL